MDNYKIKVKDEARANEARDLFKALGYHPDNSSYEPYVEWVAVFEDRSGSFYSLNMDLDECEELTLPQLRDLVVLHRNDVKDATHQDKHNASLKYAYLNNEWYEWLDGWKSGWVNTIRITPINKSKDDQLSVSGEEDRFTNKDALNALSDGKDVQYCGYDKIWRDDIHLLKIYEFSNGSYLFRLKPQTIKLELELPKPFEPEVGQEVWFIDDNSKCGYSRSAEYGSDIYSYFGWWRTEDEIKQVVEQLRKIRGTNS
ncbi:hypothetical protein VXG46_003842 [Acinetobacter baumannii]|uniref:hypothetical protein n=1 Tax=Acinetobacter baumannii TaxID=470 RepID=UPI00046108F6|nr:hypothetical protein [Acinetobacter baumannii]EMC7952610.1 hypothetical protein [Acinetobacter baumannii]EMD9694638.1 hypothetical protein [Acinetobacter baumannii]KCY22538.1 hypothetical protein J635_1964 [Acinetobacter baumannii 233846]